MMNTGQDVKNDAGAAIKEAFKVLRANIKFYGVKGKVKTVAVTSTKMNEGKTAVSTNLAMSMAETGIKVLYIDADLRKASTLECLKGGMEYGLSNLLSEGTPLADVICSTKTGNLYCIASGPKPPNPAELIEAEEFGRLLKNASESFDMVIIDTPPLGTMIDAALIAGQTDGTVIVVEANGTELRSLKRVREQLNKANARILGVVLNKVSRRNCDDYYGYYHYYDKERVKRGRWLQKLNLLRKANL